MSDVTWPMGQTGAEYRRAAELLGGGKVLRAEVDGPLEAHALIVRGIPGLAIRHLVGGLTTLGGGKDVARAMGLSLRTLQRIAASPAKSLSTEQSGRAWKFAEVLAKATEALGSQEEAERWLERPAIGLDGRRPIDLLETPAGTEIVETLLGRIAYGVYA
ncbi:MAG TPA: antitoxin Xre/MbcA/ParS toxin-binding domain-containing protein [Methylomirabilota bacterium]|nr:antitoxin Xre/MbcA/ParS toxin-binding domain-containing protein [Methylomirabilota bacterium]